MHSFGTLDVVLFAWNKASWIFKKIKEIFQNITYSTKILHGDPWRSKITIAKAKSKSLNIWNNKLLKINSCSKSAIVTAIFNERAETNIVTSNIFLLQFEIVQFASNIAPWDFTRYKESTKILHADPKRQHFYEIIYRYIYLYRKGGIIVYSLAKRTIGPKR